MREWSVEGQPLLFSSYSGRDFLRNRARAASPKSRHERRVGTMTDSPVVSILMPILNEESNLPRCLRALVAQDYPKECLELLIADGGSTDRSLEIVRDYESQLKITVLDNSKRKEAEWGKALAFESASGSYVQTVDADVWPSSPTLISRLVEVMESRKDLSGAVARYHPEKELSIWSRYLSFDEFQRDPLFQVLTPSMDEFVTESYPTFDVCTFPTSRVPPMGQTTMYRKSDMDLKRWGGRWSEIDAAAYLVKIGKRRFGYVRDVGWVHEHCSSLGQLLAKRRRNVLGMSHGFLRSRTERDFLWLDLTNKGETLRLSFYVLQANCVVPETLRGIRDCIRYRSWEQLLRPIVSIAITDTILWEFVRSHQGRSFIRHCIRFEAFHDIKIGDERELPDSVVGRENRLPSAKPGEPS